MHLAGSGKRVRFHEPQAVSGVWTITWSFLPLLGAFGHHHYIQNWYTYRKGSLAKNSIDRRRDGNQNCKRNPVSISLGRLFRQGCSVLFFFFFFFCLIILAYSLSRLWRRTFCPIFPSAVRAVAAPCKRPYCPPLRPVPEEKKRKLMTNGLTKENMTRFLLLVHCRCHEGGRS